MTAGKFEGNADPALAERLHALTLDGSWQSLGDVQDFGWFGLVAEGDDWYIVTEDSQGFFTIYEGPVDKARADGMWMDLEEEYAEDQEGDG